MLGDYVKYSPLLLGPGQSAFIFLFSFLHLDLCVSRLQGEICVHAEQRDHLNTKCYNGFAQTTVGRTVLMSFYFLQFWDFDILGPCWLWKDCSSQSSQLLDRVNNLPTGEHTFTCKRTNPEPTHPTISSTGCSLSRPIFLRRNPSRARYQTTRESLGPRAC